MAMTVLAILPSKMKWSMAFLLLTNFCGHCLLNPINSSKYEQMIVMMISRWSLRFQCMWRWNKVFLNIKHLSSDTCHHYCVIITSTATNQREEFSIITYVIILKYFNYYADAFSICHLKTNKLSPMLEISTAIFARGFIKIARTAWLKNIFVH